MDSHHQCHCCRRWLCGRRPGYSGESQERPLAHRHHGGARSGGHHGPRAHCHCRHICRLYVSSPEPILHWRSVDRRRRCVNLQDRGLRHVGLPLQPRRPHPDLYRQRIHQGPPQHLRPWHLDLRHPDHRQLSLVQRGSGGLVNLARCGSRRWGADGCDQGVAPDASRHSHPLRRLCKHTHWNTRCPAPRKLPPCHCWSAPR
mmetsp:Transcript_3634/g.8350  ORF Transcript_3634/g.8350 Transcript_3634/m.8350 type:complete len:201 (+) Transcript_3634:3125-3727(+)